MSGPNAYEHMNVIGRTVDDQRRTVHFANDTAEISEKIAAKVGLDQRAPALRGPGQRMFTGSVRGPRTWPPDQVTAAGSASSKSG